MNLSNPIVYVNRLINPNYIWDMYSDTLDTVFSATDDAAVNFLNQISTVVLTRLFSVLPSPAQSK